jgi:hypothetical protein
MSNYRKITRRKNKRKNKSRKLKLNNKYRKRYQIGCSRKNYMKGGGISPIQSVFDTMNTLTHNGTGLWNQYVGEPTPQPSPNPTIHPTILV